MTLSSAKYFVLIGGVIVLTHQLWLHLRDSRKNTIEKPQTWQQSLSLSSVTLGVIAVILLMTDFGYFPIGNGRVANTTHIGGMVCFFLGGGMRAWALHSLGPNFSPDLRILAGGNLVTNGAYAFVRHPFYLSILLLAFGAGLALINVFVLVFSGVLAFILRQRIRVEEEMLVHFYQEDYLQYKQRVPKIFPSFFSIRDKQNNLE